jgi:mono/diheme cytochrome c family protein
VRDLRDTAGTSNSYHRIIAMPYPRYLTIAFVAMTGTLPAHSTTASPVRSGEQVYGRVCALCHEHRIAPTLLGRQLPAETVALIVRRGLNGMPAFRPSEIDATELDALARFVQGSLARERAQ